MLHLSSSSLLTILLILVAALSSPDVVAAQSRKLRKDGDHHQRRRRLGKSSKDSKCHKSENASCVGFQTTFSSIPIQQREFGDVGYSTISYGNGRDGTGFSASNGVGTVETKAIAVGTVVYQDGFVGKELMDGGDVVFDDPDYYFYQQCEVLRGRIKSNGKFKELVPNPNGPGPVDRVVPLKCDIFLHNGKGYSGFEDVPDTIHLRGYTKGEIDVNSQATYDGDTYEIEELHKVNDFFATVIGGTGRWAGSTGMARVFTEGFRGEDFDVAPPDNEPNGWKLDLFATVSPSYDQIFNVVDLPPPLDMTPDIINNPYDVP